MSKTLASKMVRPVVFRTVTAYSIVESWSTGVLDGVATFVNVNSGSVTVTFLER